MFIIGLDNGIIVKGVTRKQLPRFIRYPFDTDFSNNYVEVCYWRKWWPFRNAVMHKFDPNEDSYEIPLSFYRIEYISSLLKSYLKNPDDATNGYWEDETVRNISKDGIWNLFWLKRWMEKHPEAEVYFYDSY